jgi:hypothetical protein
MPAKGLPRGTYNPGFPLTVIDSGISNSQVVIKNKHNKHKRPSITFFIDMMLLLKKYIFLEKSQASRGMYTASERVLFRFLGVFRDKFFMFLGIICEFQLKHILLEDSP